MLKGLAKDINHAGILQVSNTGRTAPGEAGGRTDRRHIYHEKGQQNPAHSYSFLGEALPFFLRVTLLTRKVTGKTHMAGPRRLTKNKMDGYSSCALHKDIMFKA